MLFWRYLGMTPSQMADMYEASPALFADYAMALGAVARHAGRSQ